MRRELRWSAAAAGLAVALGSVVASNGGCTAQARYRALSTVFDGVPAPGTPPRERTRRAVAAELAEKQAVEPPGSATAPTPAPPAPSRAARLDFETYAELLAAFPKDSFGNPNWVAAARDGLIDPLASPDPDVKPMPPFPLDVRLDPGIPNFQVVFPHAAHTYWLRCDNCHPQIFQMKAGADPITMASIFQGEYCGRCHGKVAFAPQTGCPRCHVQMAAPAAR
jgi:c(7)-type cytochrome triheme protein